MAEEVEEVLQPVIPADGQIEVLFTEKNVTQILDEFETQVLNWTGDVTTSKGRAEIASRAHFISKQKVKIDEAGKSLVKEWKAKAMAIDKLRKTVRDRLDVLREQCRMPLTKWEKEKAEREEAERLALEISKCFTMAIKENELFDREQEVRRIEEELVERRRQQELKEAEDRRKRELKERELAAVDAALRAERERASKRIEEERLANLRRIAEEEKRREAAVEQARYEARLELRKEKEAEERRLREEKKRKENEIYRHNVHLAIYKSLCLLDTNKDFAKRVTKALIDGKIKHVVIEY